MITFKLFLSLFYNYLPMTAVIGNVVVSILMLRFCLKLKYPSWIFPCLFYIQVGSKTYLLVIIFHCLLQVFPYITEHFGQSFRLIRPYVSCSINIPIHLKSLILLSYLSL